MRTNIDIDDHVLEQAMRAGPYKTKKDAVEAGLKLLARQAAYRELLKWEGKLEWDGEPWSAHDKRIARAGQSVRPAVATGESSYRPPLAQEPGSGKRSHGRR